MFNNNYECLPDSHEQGETYLELVSDQDLFIPD